jgi:hypothetical protein
VALVAAWIAAAVLVSHFFDSDAVHNPFLEEV